MTSTTGTTKRGHKLDWGLSSKSISAILRASKECGVSELKLGDFYVRFGPSSPTRHVEPSLDEFPELAGSAEMESAPDLGNGLPVKVPKDLVQRFTEEQTLLDDPVAFEQQQIDLLREGSPGLDEEAQG